VNAFLRGLAALFGALADLFKSLPGLPLAIWTLLVGLWRAFLRCFRRNPKDCCTLRMPPSVYKRPDPMIYDQYYLLAQGLAVTWDNPDIQIEDLSGAPVSPDGLTPGTDYKVIVRVWNNSYDAPAAGLPVYLSYLSFGIGITSTPVGLTTTNLGVKGSAHCPAFAPFVWQTPTTPGHYCLQALLIWPDDANPFNNLGQKNTQVGQTHSPAVFSVPVQNQADVKRHFQMEADMYQFPAPPPCTEQRAIPASAGRFAESTARWEEALRTQAYGQFPVTPAWNVEIDPAEFDLDAGASTVVSVSVEPSSGSFTGIAPFNIHAFASIPGRDKVLAGGVTLYVQGV
jgi:hypothetical protein